MLLKPEQIVGLRRQIEVMKPILFAPIETLDMPPVLSAARDGPSLQVSHARAHP